MNYYWREKPNGAFTMSYVTFSDHRGSGHRNGTMKERGWSDRALPSTEYLKLSLLLKVAFLLEDPPAVYVSWLSEPYQALVTSGGQHMRALSPYRIATCARKLRALLPTYLEKQEASVVAHCPLPRLRSFNLSWHRSRHLLWRT